MILGIKVPSFVHCGKKYDQFLARVIFVASISNRSSTKFLSEHIQQTKTEKARGIDRQIERRTITQKQTDKESVWNKSQKRSFDVAFSKMLRWFRCAAIECECDLYRIEWQILCVCVCMKQCCWANEWTTQIEKQILHWRMYKIVKLKASVE